MAKADWPWINERLRQRSGGACERCGRFLAEDGGERHHRKLRSGQGEDTLDNLVLLCRDCHTGSPDGVHSQVAEAKRNGFIVTKFGEPGLVPLKHALHDWILLFRDGSWQPAMFAEPAEGVG